jgi:radical SAM superfamily enzyme YgiQ (UPF0313 family)
LEPLGLEYLASYLETQGHACQVLQQRCEPRDRILQQVADRRPEVLGIGTQAYNIDDALWFAREAKKALPGLVVVLGGYHASAMPDLVTAPEVDYVVVGEGEIAFSELLKRIHTPGDVASVPGIAYFDGQVHVNERPARICDLDTIPFPKRSRTILQQCRMHGLMYPPPSQQTYVGTVTATRGCPYSCAFCCSQLIWNHEVRHRSPENVADELEVMADEFGVNAVFFCDLTFNASKAYTIRLCEEITRRDVPIHFYAMCNLRGMDREIAEAMAAAKCAKVGFGVESFVEATRRKMKDRGGLDVQTSSAILDEVSAAGVLTKAYFIIGFPWETPESLTQLRDDISLLRADEIKATFYVPFPGTEGYRMHQSLLTTDDWSRFTTLSEPVVRNEAVSPDELKHIRRGIFDSFYNGSLWRTRVAERVVTFPKYRESFAEFTAFLREQGILKSAIPLVENGGSA